MISYRISTLLLICLSIATAPIGNCYPEADENSKPITFHVPNLPLHDPPIMQAELSKEWLDKLSTEIKKQWALDSKALRAKKVKCRCYVNILGQLKYIEGAETSSTDERVVKVACELLKKVPPIDRGYIYTRVPPYGEEIVDSNGNKRSQMVWHAVPAKSADVPRAPAPLFIEFGRYPNVTLTEDIGHN